MGRINRFVCPSCNASWQIALGHGIGHAVLEDVLELFPAEIRRNILCDTAGEQISSFEFNYRPAICQQCKKMVPVPVIYFPMSGKTYSSSCPDCNGSLTLQPEKAELICPRCGNSALSSEEIGLWD
ncbi:Trm112 family protein [Lachnospiraceae bacterium 56-18]